MKRENRLGSRVLGLLLRRLAIFLSRSVKSPNESGKAAIKQLTRLDNKNNHDLEV